MKIWGARESCSALLVSSYPVHRGVACTLTRVNDRHRPLTIIQRCKAVVKRPSLGVRARSKEVC